MKRSKDTFEVFGKVSYARTGQPAANLKVIAKDLDIIGKDDLLGTVKTNKAGEFHVKFSCSDFNDLSVFDRRPDLYVEVYDENDKLVTTTREAVIRNAGARQEINVLIPGGEEPGSEGFKVGGTAVDRRVFNKLNEKHLLEITKLAKNPDEKADAAKILEKLSPELALSRLKEQQCFTPLTDFILATAKLKKFKRETFLEIEEIFFLPQPHFAAVVYTCGNFTITYQNSGPDAIPLTDTAEDIIEPGTGVVVGTTVAGNGVPNYIEKLCYWLNNAYATYTNAPFSLAPPITPINVDVSGTSFGSAWCPNNMNIAINLNDDLLAAVSTHELMHLIQCQYRSSGSGDWDSGMTEGGATFGEDVVFDTHNRYIVEASTSVGGNGTLLRPEASLFDSSMRYKLSLFIKYISEQQSANVAAGNEPAIGVETYRILLEHFDAGGYTHAALRTAINALPWRQRFDNFSFLDSARLDEVNSETLLGNFWAALYLKDLGIENPDRRFDFMEDEENASWDNIFAGANLVDTMGAVALTSTGTVSPFGGTVVLGAGTGSSVSSYGARYYRVDIDSGVDTFRISFNSSTTGTRPIIQLILVEDGNVVRDIIRTDRSNYERTIANLRNGNLLDHVIVIVAGTDAAITYSLVADTSPAMPDVMITRWHHVAGTAYEIDSFGWAWTWVSPDIWVDNNGDGTPDQVYFSQNNQLYVRLRNQGNADATGITVEVFYQDASDYLQDSQWVPVQNTAGVTQTLTGLTLAAGATNQWSLDWAPVNTVAGSDHFCTKVVVTVPGDPNTDNKRLVSNFHVVNPYATKKEFVDVAVRRLVQGEDPNYRFDVIPRGMKDFQVSKMDQQLAEAREVKQGEEVMDQFRIRKVKTRVHDVISLNEIPVPYATKGCSCCGDPSVHDRPDIRGDYETHPDALPPGMANFPMVTIATVSNGEVIGGNTFMLKDEKPKG